MPHINRTRRVSVTAATAVVVLLLASLALAACGGSSSSSSTSANAAATSATGATGTAGRGAGRFTALRECLQKNGITLPKRTPGQRPRGGAGGFLGGGAGGAGGPHLPNGVSRAQYEAAVKKCGGGAFAGGGGRFNSPAAKQALAKFATCMRENGVNVPEPNTSGGPIFNSKGLNTSSPKFKAAEAKCQSDLRGAFLRGRGGRPPTGPGGEPGGSGATAPPQ
jgi:hypothetical protein